MPGFRLTHHANIRNDTYQNEVFSVNGHKIVNSEDRGIYCEYCKTGLFCHTIDITQEEWLYGYYISNECDEIDI